MVHCFCVKWVISGVSHRNNLCKYHRSVAPPVDVQLASIGRVFHQQESIYIRALATPHYRGQIGQDHHRLPSAATIAAHLMGHLRQFF